MVSVPAYLFCFALASNLGEVATRSVTARLLIYTRQGYTQHGGLKRERHMSSTPPPREPGGGGRGVECWRRAVGQPDVNREEPPQGSP